MTKTKLLSFLFGAEVLLLMALAYMQPAHALPAPTNLTANVASTTQINLKWDRVWGASSYRVFRASKQIATVRGTTFSNINLTPNTTYSYNVAAVDTRWRQSELSNTATATTLTDTNPPPTTTAEVGYIGCSMTIGAINGALRLNPSGYWPVYNIGGGGVSKWADLNSQYWKDFQTAYNANPVKTFWFELCALSTEKDKETIDAAMAVIDELKRRIPDVTIYVSAQPTYTPTSHVCQIAGSDGPQRMSDIASTLIMSGEVKAGPAQGPLNADSQLKPNDSCHPNTSGEDLLGKQVQDFFFNLNPPPPSAGAGIASGIYVVDTEPNVSAALASPYTDGLLVRARWEQVESTEGVFVTKGICDKVTQAHSLGKGVSLVFYPLPPKWLLAKVPTSEQWTLPLGRSTLTINPWNTTLLAAMSKTAAAIANSTCEGVPLRSHPALKQVDTTIAGALSVRDKPASATQAQMSGAVMSSVKIWRSAFYTENDTKAYYMSIFPYRDKAVDAAAIAKEVLSAYPYQHFMTENFGVAGVGDTSILKLAKYKIFQACGYFGNSKIKCSDTGRADNTPQTAYDKILKPLGGTMSLQIYADDIISPTYAKELEYLHKAVNP